MTGTADVAARAGQTQERDARGFGTPAYRTYVLNALLLIYVLNFVDRGLLSVAAAPIKAEIGISDTAFGLLTGFGFALLYTIVGIPLARLAENHSRVKIMAASVALWSVMTALCGLATDIVVFGAVVGGFWVLLLCRIGVGVGEAGCTPPANSLIADYYPPEKRSSALGYYAMGVTLGGMLASLIGGPVTDWFGWRWAFFILGVPGILIAAVLLFTVKEPPRGYTDPAGATKTDRAELGPAIRELMSKPSYWLMTAGATLAAFCGYGIASFQTLYLVRTFGVSTGQAAIWFNTPAGLAGAIGTVALGVLATRLRARNKASIAWLAAAGLLLSVPLYLMAFMTSSMVLCVVGLAGGHFVKYGYLTAQYTIGQGVVSTRVRATATAVLLFVVNLVGYGVGPLFAGIVSDVFFRADLAEAGYLGTVDRALCDAASHAVASAERLGGVGSGDVAGILGALERPITTAQYEFCLTANASSAEASMIAITLIYILAAAFFALCARRLADDLVA